MILTDILHQIDWQEIPFRPAILDELIEYFDFSRLGVRVFFQDIKIIDNGCSKVVFGLFAFKEGHWYRNPNNPPADVSLSSNIVVLEPLEETQPVAN